MRAEEVGLRAGDSVGVSDEITTSYAGRVVLREGATIVSVGPDARVKLVASPACWQLVSGSLSVQVAGIDSRVDSAFGTASARDARFVVESIGAGVTIRVIEGTVDFAPKAGAHNLRLERGHSVAVTDSGPGQIVTFDLDAESHAMAEAREQAEAVERPNSDLAVAGGFGIIAVAGASVGLLARRRRNVYCNDC